MLCDFYDEAKRKAEQYPDVRWVFLLSTQELEPAENIEVIRDPGAIRSWLHRAIYNAYTVRRIAKDKHAAALVSLQNMAPRYSSVPNLISLHNVLPLYRCDKTVLDSAKLRAKQALVNMMIRSSLRKAYAVFIPSRWIKEALIDRVGVDSDRIYIDPLVITVDPSGLALTGEMVGNEAVFFYPAAAFPYKNHAVIVAACKLLKARGIGNYKVLFTFAPDENKTTQALYCEAQKTGLPIEFVGALPREGVLALYRKSVLLFPSRIETDAMPLLECAAMGGHIVCADLPYAREALEGYGANDFFGQGDAEALSNIMERVVKNGPKRSEKAFVREPREKKTRLDHIVRLVQKIS